MSRGAQRGGPLRWAQWLRGTPRAAAVEADIEAELQRHVAMLEQELQAGGLGEAEARAEARRRFGDARAVFAACRRVRLREHDMVRRRIQVAALVLLAAAVVFFAWQAHDARRQARAEREQSLQVIAELQQELTRLPARLAAHDGLALEQPAIGTFIEVLAEQF